MAVECDQPSLLYRPGCVGKMGRMGESPSLDCTTREAAGVPWEGTDRSRVGGERCLATERKCVRLAGGGLRIAIEEEWQWRMWSEGIGDGGRRRGRRDGESGWG